MQCGVLIQSSGEIQLHDKWLEAQLVCQRSWQVDLEVGKLPVVDDSAIIVAVPTRGLALIAGSLQHTDP